MLVLRSCEASNRSERMKTHALQTGQYFRGLASDLTRFINARIWFHAYHERNLARDLQNSSVLCNCTAPTCSKPLCNDLNTLNRTFENTVVTTARIRNSEGREDDVYTLLCEVATVLRMVLWPRQTQRDCAHVVELMHNFLIANRGDCHVL